MNIYKGYYTTIHIVMSNYSTICGLHSPGTILYAVISKTTYIGEITSQLNYKRLTHHQIQGSKIKMENSVNICQTYTKHPNQSPLRKSECKHTRVSIHSLCRPYDFT